jgi:hypothetical protein
MEASEVGFILSCSEEAMEDQYNRGGGVFNHASRKVIAKSPSLR